MASPYPDPIVVKQFDTRDDEVEILASESYFGEVTVSMRRKPAPTTTEVETATAYLNEQ